MKFYGNNLFSFHLAVSIIREDSPTDVTTISACSPTPTTDNIVSELCSDLKNKSQSHMSVSTIEDSTTNGVVNHAFSTDTLYNQLPIPDSVPATTIIPPVQQQTMNETWRNMCSVILELLKNTRFIFIVIANLFEGILLKGKLFLYRS